MIYRIFFDVLLFLCIAFFPWWVALIWGVIGVVIFPSFYEILFAGIIVDSLYTSVGTRSLNFECVVSISSVAIFIAIELLKYRLRFYSKGHLSL